MGELGFKTMEMSDNAHYLCKVSRKWFGSEHGIVQMVDFGTYLTFSTETTGGQFLEADQVMSLDEVVMDEDQERPYLGYTFNSGFRKEESMVPLDKDWSPYLLCPREGCIYSGRKQIQDIRSLRRHYRYSCRAKGGPQHSCNCLTKCAEYVLDDGPQIPDEGFKKMMWITKNNRRTKLIVSGWFYKPFREEYNEYDIVTKFQPAEANQFLMDDINDEVEERMLQLKEQTALYENVLEKIESATSVTLKEMEAKLMTQLKMNSMIVGQNTEMGRQILGMREKMNACNVCRLTSTTIDPVEEETGTGETETEGAETAGAETEVNAP